MWKKLLIKIHKEQRELVVVVVVVMVEGPTLAVDRAIAKEQEDTTAPACIGRSGRSVYQGNVELQKKKQEEKGGWLIQS